MPNISLASSCTYPVHPATNTRSPVTTAREYPISSSNEEPELISVRALVVDDCVGGLEIIFTDYSAYGTAPNIKSVRVDISAVRWETEVHGAAAKEHLSP